MRRLCIVSCFILATVIPTVSYAWDGDVVGVISRVEVDPPLSTNYQFRVALVNGNAMCGNANTWAYINTTFGNYQASVGVLLTSYTTGKTVEIFSTRDVTTGYCQIGYIIGR